MRRLLATLVFLFAALPVLAIDPWYEVETLNEGLGAPPDSVDRSTPQTAMASFLDLAAAGDYDAAAHLLNLTDLDPGAQAADGAVLARQLYIVLDRKVVIPWNALLERPDALDETATTESAVAGQVRRSILIGMLTIDDRGTAIRLNRLKPAEGEPVWVFSEQTVANIPALIVAYGPSRFERWLPEALRTEAISGLMWWELIGIPIALAAALMAGWLAWRALSPHRWEARHLTARILRAVRLPAAIFMVSLILALVSGAFVFSGMISIVLNPLLAMGFTIAAMALVLGVVDAILDRIVSFEDQTLRDIDKNETRSLATRLSAVRRILIVIIVCVGTGIVLSEAQLFRTFGFSLLASAGVLTLILGFAARRILGNIMASIQIALNQSARIGDKVMFRDHLCHVERINFTYVQLRVWTGVRLIVPVEEFTSESFENWTLKEPALTRLITMKVVHQADVEQLRKMFFDIIADGPEEGELGDEAEHKVVVEDQDVFGKTVMFCLHCANPNTAWALSCEVREELMRRISALEAEGQRIFPTANPAEAA